MSINTSILQFILILLSLYFLILFFFACFVFEDFLSICLKRDPQFECTEIIFIILRLFTSRLSLTFYYLFIFVIIPCRFSLRTALVYWLEAAHKNQDRNARGRVRNAITGINNIWDHFNPGLHPSSFFLLLLAYFYSEIWPGIFYHPHYLSVVAAVSCVRSDYERSALFIGFLPRPFWLYISFPSFCPSLSLHLSLPLPPFPLVSDSS